MTTLIQWGDYPLETLRRDHVEIVSERAQFDPHAVLRFLDLPGLGTITASFHWSQFNRRHGVGINRDSFEVLDEYGVEWCYLLRRYRDMSLMEILDQIGRPLQAPFPVIRGRLVRVEDVRDFLTNAKVYPDSLRERKGGVSFIDPSDFSESAMNVITR